MLRNLVTILVRPRATMRRVLDSRERIWIALVVLFTLSGTLGDTERGGFRNLARAASAHGIPAALLFTALFLALVVVGFIIFYLFAWAAWAIGRALEGKGSAAEVRRGVAWGLVPGVWALLYRLPVALLWNPPVSARVKAGAERLVVDPGRMGGGCLMGIAFTILELAAFIWCLTAVSNTIGEAHRFSSWRGLATVVLTSLAPLVLVVAAVLAM